MQRISQRHEGDLDKRLRPFDETSGPSVTISIPPRSADLPATQHTAWMLLNILSRLQGIVKDITIVCPQNTNLIPNVVPIAADSATLRDALLAASNLLPFVQVTYATQPRGHVLNVSPIADRAATLNVYGQGWWGGTFSAGEVASSEASSLPFGPYVAACIAAAEVFKIARMRENECTPCRNAFYSAWTYSSGNNPDTSGPPELTNLRTSGALLAGVGAVGSAFLHSLWPLNIEGQLHIADNDPVGLDATNLNRYALFSVADIGHPKASRAAGIFSSKPLRLLPHDGGFDYFFRHSESRPRTILSAVDNNIARSALQDQYPPLLLSASTSDLRAELLRCGPPGIGACLRCFNPPENAPTDEEIKNRLRNDKETAAKTANTLGVSRTQLDEWLHTNKCGQAGDRLLAHLRTSANDPERFAVAFVSIAAGTMLAAQFVKTLMSRNDAALDESRNRAVLQFWHLLAETNRASFYPREHKCPKCQASNIATRTWARRFQSAHY